MKIIVVVGSGSGCGKTTVVGRILRDIPGLGAVKLSPREGETRVEWGPGSSGKDTDVFTRSGAAPVARIVGPRETLLETWAGIKGQFEGCRAVVIEGARAIDFPDEKFVLFVVGKRDQERRLERERSLIGSSNLVVEVISHGTGPKPLDLQILSHSSSTWANARSVDSNSRITPGLDPVEAVRSFIEAQVVGRS